MTWKPDAGLTIRQQRFATTEATVFVESASVIQGKIPMRSSREIIASVTTSRAIATTANFVPDQTTVFAIAVNANALLSGMYLDTLLVNAELPMKLVSHLMENIFTSYVQAMANAFVENANVLRRMKVNILDVIVKIVPPALENAKSCNHACNVSNSNLVH